MRGVVTMRVGAAEHPLAPTFGAYRDLEERLRTSLGQLYVAHLRQALTLEELAVIVTVGMNQAQAGSAEVESVAQHLFELGANSEAVARPVAEYLLALGWAPEEARKKLEAEWGAEPERAAA